MAIVPLCSLRLISVWSVCLFVAFGCGCQKQESPDSGSPPGQPASLALKEGGAGREKAVAPPAGIADKPESANQPPEVERIVLEPAIPFRGKDLQAQVFVRDAEGDEAWFQYRWIINGEEYFWGKENILPGDSFQRGDRISLEVTPRDIHGEGSAFHSSEIEVMNAAPLFLSDPPQGFQGWDYVYDAKASDADGDPVVYSLVQAPEGMSVDSSNGQVRWKIGTEGSGEHTIKLKATDPVGAAAEQEILLNVVIRKDTVGQ